MLRSLASALLLAWVECSRPEVLPASIPDPVAYYPLNDGEGYLLKETMSGKPDAGYVTPACRTRVMFGEYQDL